MVRFHLNKGDVKMKNKSLVCVLVLALLLTAMPALAVNVNVGGEVNYVFVAPISTRKPSASSNSEIKYSFNTTIDKKWFLKVDYNLSFSKKTLDEAAKLKPEERIYIDTFVDKIEIKYADKNLNFAAYKNPGGSIGELKDTHNLLVFPTPWGDPNGYMLRGSAKPFGVNIDCQVIDSGWYASEMNGFYIRGSADIKGNTLNIAGRTINGEKGVFDLYQGALHGAIPIGKLKLEPGIGLTQRNDKKKDNMAFGIKLAGPVVKDLEIDVSTRLSQANFESRYFNGDYSEQKAAVTWKKMLKVSGELVGPLSDWKTRTLTLNTEWRNSTSNNDFAKQFEADKYYTNNDFGLGLKYIRDKKSEADNPENTILVRGTTPVLPKKLWVLGSATLVEDKDYLEKGIYTSTKKINTSLKAQAKVIPKVTMDGYFDYKKDLDSKISGEPIKVESGALGLSAKYDFNNTVSVGGKYEINSNRFGEGNTVLDTVGANWLIKTSDNAKFEMGYLRTRNLLEKEPTNHLVSAAIKLKF